MIRILNLFFKLKNHRQWLEYQYFCELRARAKFQPLLLRYGEEEEKRLQDALQGQWVKTYACCHKCHCVLQSTISLY